MQPTRYYISQFIYFNKMLYMFQAVPPPIIRSSNCTYSFWYLSNLAASCRYHGWDGTGLDANRLKLVEYFMEINTLRSLASCWLHFGNILKMHGLMNTELFHRLN
jgi:hypothetical protein